MEELNEEVSRLTNSEEVLNSKLKQATTDLEKARRDMKEKGDLARSMLEEKDAEIRRLQTSTEKPRRPLRTPQSTSPPASHAQPHPTPSSAPSPGQQEEKGFTPLANLLEIEEDDDTPPPPVDHSQVDNAEEELAILQEARRQANRDAVTASLHTEIAALKATISKQAGEVTARDKHISAMKSQVPFSAPILIAFECALV